MNKPLQSERRLISKIRQQTSREEGGIYIYIYVLIVNMLWPEYISIKLWTLQNGRRRKGDRGTDWGSYCTMKIMTCCQSEFVFNIHYRSVHEHLRQRAKKFVSDTAHVPSGRFQLSVAVQHLR